MCIRDSGNLGVDGMATLQGTTQIGSSTANTNGTLLVLNDASADPGTAVDGAMYYNSTDNSFRCGENGVWRSCVGGLANASTAASSSITATSITNFGGGTNNSYTVLANDCQTGVTYLITAQGTYTSTSATPKLTLSLDEDGTSVVLATSGTMTVAATTAGWQLSAQMVCDSTTSVEVQGQVTVGTSTTAAGEALLDNTATETWTTSSHTLYIGATWSSSTGSPSATMRQLIVQREGPKPLAFSAIHVTIYVLSLIHI